MYPIQHNAPDQFKVGDQVLLNFKSCRHRTYRPVGFIVGIHKKNALPDYEIFKGDLGIRLIEKERGPVFLVAYFKPCCDEIRVILQWWLELEHSTKKDIFDARFLCDTCTKNLRKKSFLVRSDNKWLDEMSKCCEDCSLLLPKKVRYSPKKSLEDLRKELENVTAQLADVPNLEKRKIAIIHAIEKRTGKKLETLLI